MRPDNFRISEDGRVYNMDFGNFSEYKVAGRHKFKGNHGRQGTPMYASINSLEGFTLGRRDDIESLAYLIMNLIDSYSIPWIFME